MKKLALLIVALFSAAALAQDLPRIAVYVTGDVPDNEKKALGTRMLASLINSKRYKGIERSNSFLAEIEREQEKQRSGEIDDSQISALGKQFGVKFVCIADITPAFGAFQVSARIINVETAEVEFIGESASPLNTFEDLAKVSDQVVKNMFGEEAKTIARKPAPGAVSQAKPEPPKKEPNPPRLTRVYKADVYFAGRYVLPIGGMPRWGAGDIEYGRVWDNGMFFGFDINMGVYVSEEFEVVDNKFGTRTTTDREGIVGCGFNLGRTFDLPVKNLQLVYGGAVGYWETFLTGADAWSRENFLNFLAPFIKLRWKFVELSYRGLLGLEYENNKSIRDKSFNWNHHQVMLGVYFARRVSF